MQGEEGDYSREERGLIQDGRNVIVQDGRMWFIQDGASQWFKMEGDNCEARMMERSD